MNWWYTILFSIRLLKNTKTDVPKACPIPRHARPQILYIYIGVRGR